MANTWLHVTGDASGVLICQCASFTASPGGLLIDGGGAVRDRVGFTNDNGFVRVTQNNVNCTSCFSFLDDCVADLTVSVCAGGTGTFTDTSGGTMVTGSNIIWNASVGGGCHDDTLTLTALSLTLEDPCCGCKSLLVSQGTDFVVTGLTAATPAFTTIAGGLGTVSFSSETDVEYIIRHDSIFSDIRGFVSDNSRDCPSTITFRDDSSNTCLVLTWCACTTGEQECNCSCNNQSVTSGSTINYGASAGASSMGSDSITWTILSIYQNGVGHNVVSSNADERALGQSCVIASSTVEGGLDLIELCTTNADVNQPIEWVATNLFVRMTANDACCDEQAELTDDDCAVLTAVICAGQTGTFEDTCSVTLASDSDLRSSITNLTGGCGYSFTYIGFELQQPSACGPNFIWTPLGAWINII